MGYIIFKKGLGTKKKKKKTILTTDLKEKTSAIDGPKYPMSSFYLCNSQDSGHVTFW